MSTEKEANQVNETNPKTTAARKKAPKKKASFGAKAEFIRRMPMTMPAKEVVAQAKKEGIEVSLNHVYNLRSTGGKTKAKKKARAKHMLPTILKPSSSKPVVLDSSAIKVSYSPAALKSNESVATDALNTLIDNRIREFFLAMAGKR